MKNFIYVAVLALVMTACAANGSKKEIVATDIVPAAATDVLPAAAPVPGLGTVATDVVPAE
jgi:hypothetical protein